MANQRLTRERVFDIMEDMLDTLTPAVARSVISQVYEAALNHIHSSLMVGIESDSLRKLEEACARMPCLYCGVNAFEHDENCPRYIFRGLQSYEVA